MGSPRGGLYFEKNGPMKSALCLYGSCRLWALYGFVVFEKGVVVVFVKAQMNIAVMDKERAADEGGVVAGGI